MSPLVLAPQIKNVPASSQNDRVRDAICKARSGAIAFGGVAGDASAA